MKKTLRLVLALVLTVAVLATGLIFANAATTVTSNDEFVAAIAAGDSEINITADFNLTSKLTITQSVKINGGNYTVTCTGQSGEYFVFDGDGTYEISGGTFTTTGGDPIYGGSNFTGTIKLTNGAKIMCNSPVNFGGSAQGTFILDGGIIESSKQAIKNQGATNIKLLSGSVSSTHASNAVVTTTGANKGTFTFGKPDGTGPTITRINDAGTGELVYINANNEVEARSHVVYGGTFNNPGTGAALYFGCKANITIEGGTFVGGGGHYLINFKDGTGPYNMLIKGGNFTAKENMFISDTGDYTVAITGGTFNVDPTTYVTDPNCTIAKDGDNWVVTPGQRVPETWEVFDYDSWEESITNCEDGDTINISADVVDDLEIREITGKKLTFTGTGSVTFDGANATQTGLLIGTGAEVIFNGPSFATTQKDAADCLIIADSDNADKKALVTINAGTFTGQISIKNNANVLVNGGTFNNAVENDNVHIIELHQPSSDFEITGGTFNVVSRASGGDTAAIYIDEAVNKFNINILNATINVNATMKNTYGAYVRGGNDAENVFNVKNCTVTNDGHGRAFHFRKTVMGAITIADSSFSNNGPQCIFGFWVGNNTPAPTITLKNVTAIHTGTDEWSAVVAQGDNANTVYVDGCNFTSVMPTIWLRDHNVSLVATGAPSTFTCLSTNAVRAADGCTFTDNGLVTVNNEAGKFAITFDAQGATNPANATTELTGKLAELPVVSKVGYIFNGWFDAQDGGNQVTVDTVFTAPATVYAQWTACDHKASTAQPNCKSGATCTVCGFEMPAGEHNNVWKYDANQHWQECDGCGTVAGEKANHSGGTATCSKEAVCAEANCGQKYGEKDATNHESTEFTYIENADGTTHTKKNACCGAVAVADEAHEFGDDNICDYCEYTKGYKVTEGDAQNVEEGKDATFKIDADFSKFTNAVVKVDGTVVDAENYTAVEGSIVITLKASYLDTLDAGNHTLEVTLADGAAVSSTFTTVKAGGAGNEGGNTEQKPAPNPGTQTGDFTNITLLFVLVAVSGLAMTTLTIRGKKRA